jgi:hypothetical protein
MPTFTATLTKYGTSAVILLPFDPVSTWGARPRYHITGTVNAIAVRGALQVIAQSYMLKLGPAWMRDCGIPIGSEVTVTLALEGPQGENLAADIVAALQANPVAKAFFDGLPTFYRKKYLRWIDGTKSRPDVRGQRITELINLLSNGQRERL